MVWQMIHTQHGTVVLPHQMPRLPERVRSARVRERAVRKHDQRETLRRVVGE